MIGPEARVAREEALAALIAGGVQLPRSKSQPEQRGDKALSAATELRDIILAREDGAYLGSQDQLMQMLGVGRVSLQQTARLLEHERLLQVRRGVNGGYYGSRPDEGGVEATVAVYLRANNCGLKEAFQIRKVLAQEMLRLAAHSNDEAARAELASIGDVLQTHTMNDYEWLVRTDATFQDVVYRLAANPLGELILRVTAKLYLENFVERLDAQAREHWRRTRLNMVRAILDHDTDYAQLLSRRFSDAIWAELKRQSS